MKKSVLLLGDSIRIGYCKKVRALLEDIADVYFPDDNCAYTKKTYWNFTIWAGERHYDVIHWNNGIWDLHHVSPFGDHFSTLEEYLYDNKRLARLAREYGDKLIWATSIPGGKRLNERKAINALENTDRAFPKRFLTDAQEPWNAGIREYNEAAVKMYTEEGVRIDDLYSIMDAHLEDFISEDGIHPNEAGYTALAEQVASVIRKALED